MLNVFLDNRFYFRYPKKEYTRFDYIQRMYKREYNRVHNYYRERGSRVPTQNLLSRLVFMVAPDIDNNIVEYFRLTDSRAKYIAKLFGISSTVNVGKIMENIFYLESQELLLYTEHDYDLFNMQSNWWSYSPIRVIYTDDTDLDFRMLNGTIDKQSDIVSVYEVDVILMCLMYKYWAIERRLKDKSIHPSYFIYNIILPNMMKQHFDLCIFNRFMNLYYDRAMLDDRYKHPFMVSDYTSGVDNVLKNIIKDTANQTMAIEAIINRIPTVFSVNMLEVLYIDAPYYNRQNEWVLWMARLQYIIFFLDLLGEKGKNRNRQYYNDLAIQIRYIENGATNIYNRVKGANAEKIREYIQKIKQVCGRR